MTIRAIPRTAHTPAARLGLRVVAILLAVLAALSSNVHAQSTVAAGDPGTNTNGGTEPRRFAETWRPTVKAPASVKHQPYAPIKKADDQGQIPEIEMYVGESRVFPAPGVARIAIGNGQIMSAASLDNKEVIVFANAVGTSSLFIWNEDGRYQRVKINIVPGDTSRYAREIAGFLSAIPNAKASVIGDKVIVEGDNLNDVDIAKIDELAKRYPQIVNFTNRLGWEQMVLMDVKVVEFPINELREIGLKWAATGGAAVGGVWGPVMRGGNGYQINLLTGTSNPAPIGPAGGGTTFPIPAGLNVLSVVNMGLNAQLALLEQNGKATILAEPQLSARNGAKASFLAGGEYPYTVSTINGQTVIFKPYGVKLDIVPRVDRQGVIRATIESEVSAIDTSFSTVAGPAISMRKTNTEFNVRNGETLVLSGLLSRKTSVGIDKVPFLGDIPILGALFRSRRFQNDETELVVFVTPTIVDSKSPGLVDRIERTTQKLQGNLGRTPYLSDPIQPERDPARSDEPSPVSGAPATNAEAPSAATNQPVSAASAVAALHSPQSITANARPEGQPGKRYRVKASSLALRVTPDVNAPIVRYLAGDTVLEGLPQPVKGNWIPVQAGELRGWVAAQWLTPDAAGEH
jgi:pilus assembly protein CpaC